MYIHKTSIDDIIIDIKNGIEGLMQTYNVFASSIYNQDELVKN